WQTTLAMFTCEFCHREKPTLKGLRSHISQSPPCRQAQRAKLNSARPKAKDTQQHEELLPEGDSLLDYEPADLDYEMPESGNAIPTGMVQESSESDPASKRRRVQVEEVPDEQFNVGGIPKKPWIESFPTSAGAVQGEGSTAFEENHERQRKANEAPWAPFESLEEWELAKWLLTSGLSQRAVDDFLRLRITQDRMRLSFLNKYAFFKKVDALPRTTEWTCERFEAVGDELDENGNRLTETLELWKRDPVEVIRELIGNPDFREHIKYAPEHLYSDPEGQHRLYENMWSADWWWKTQARLPEGATIAPVILASDKTSLSRFSGDKTAWPGYRLFHRCMRSLLEPLIAAGREGVEMVCADGCIRRVYPILAAYIADHPEQCLIACCAENFCPKCTVAPDNRGDGVPRPPRNVTEICSILEAAAEGSKPVKFSDWGLRAVNPFWKDLPMADIFGGMTPDILHQLHKGVFKDHIVKWATACTDGGKLEVDRRFRAMPRHPELRHFKKGVSLVSQWTGTEYKNMEKVFLGVLSGGADGDVTRAVCAVLDFIHYAHFEIHSERSLRALDDAWRRFHCYKRVFVRLGVRKHFNIPKIHSMEHYVRSIRELGTADGYSTESPERLHIDFAKIAYGSSNKKAGYTSQMAGWLQRREAMRQQDSYIRWAMVRSGRRSPQDLDDEPPGGDRSKAENEDDEDEFVRGFKIAKKPAHPRTTVAELEGKFGATDFTHCLEDYCRKLAGPTASGSSAVTRRSAEMLPIIIENSRFDVYSQFKVRLTNVPQVSLIAKPAVDTIQAYPARASRGIQLAAPSYFSTVIAREPRLNTGDQSPQGIDGLRAGQVRAIFKISESVCSAAGLSPAHAALPVVYIEWFTPFHARDELNGMHILTRSTRQHRQYATIVPVTDIMRSCHLIPVWGPQMDRSWTSETALAKAKKYWLNCYLRHQDFVELHYILNQTS
ncbi:hypothetical protein OBBRIDRAFT_739626, partial [Obba rivulosa]